MYAGDYLASNLGHEIINLFQADNGRHYLYLNSSGNLSREHEDIDAMLLVKAHSPDTFEVIGLARGLHLVPGVTAPKHRDISKKVDSISAVQRQFIENEPGGVTYGGISILDIFNDAEQQNIFITCRADKVSVPDGSRIFLRYNKDAEHQFAANSVTVALRAHNMPRTSLKSYIYGDTADGRSDFDNIRRYIIENDSLWTSDINWKPAAGSENRPKRISLFDICKMRDDENRISNAIAYFMTLEAYKPLWRDFFRKYNINLNNDYTVDREVSAKTADAAIATGGRIDLLIRDKENFVVIENKIKSDINSVETDNVGTNQLNRYINYAESVTAESGQRPYYLVVAPNYNIPKIEGEAAEKYRIITYRDICNYLEEPTNMALIEKDANFLALYDVMRWQTFDTPNEYLYYEMQEKFQARLANSNKQTTSHSIEEPNRSNTEIENKIINHTKNIKKMAIKSAISGEYIITQEDNHSIRVCQIFDNVIASLREAAKSVGFKIEPNWRTTQGIGKKMVDALGDGYTAEAGEYTIVRRDSGHIDTYRVHGNTMKVLNTIASSVDFAIDPKWNTRTAGSKLIDFINGDYTPESADEPEEEMFEIRPDMTILELFDNFKAQFGGHLRIKDGVKRCDPHWNHQTTAVWVPVTEGTLADIGCKAPGKFSVDMKVGDFQNEVKKECGVTVLVATPDNFVTVLPEFTLDAVNLLPKGLTKAKMQDILDR